MSNTRLKVEELTAGYGDLKVLEGLSFDLASGELLAVMGGSGTGKSTLLSVLCAFMNGSAGEIHVDETLMTSEGSHRVNPGERKMGLMFQNFALFPHMSVGENIAFGIKDKENAHARVKELLELVELAGYEDRSPQSLSGGQKQRVALVRALAPRPALLLLDEPFANLDAEIRHPIARLLKRILKQEGTAALMVTHDHQDALRLADRVAILEPLASGGCSFSQIDSPENIFWHPKTRSVASLTGPAIFLDAQIHEGIASCALGSIPLKTEVHGSHTLMLRPETLDWTESENGTFEVREVYFCGPGYGADITGDGLEITLENLSVAPNRGSKINLKVNRDPVLLSG